MRGKVALVIGAGQGIGESTALRLAQAGCQLALVDIDIERARTVEGQVRALGANACSICADILHDGDIKAALQACEQQLGAPDVAVTVVGQAQYTPALELTSAEWDLDHQRNLRYVFVTAREFAMSWAGSVPGISATVIPGLRMSQITQLMPLCRGVA